MPSTPSSTSSLSALFATSLLTLALTACGGSSNSNSGPSSSSESSSSSSSSSESSSSSSSSESSSSVSYFSIEPDFQLYSLADFPVGVAVSAANEPNSIFNSADAAERRELIIEHFSQLSADNIMKMNYLHPRRGEFTFDDADELVNFAQANGMTIHGHSTVWHSDYQVPDFMKNFEGDQEEWAEMLTEHVSTIINHFPEDVVVSWDVVNEAVDTTNNGWRHSLFYNAFGEPEAGDIPEYIKVAFRAARDANPNIELYYNDYDNTANEIRRERTLDIAKALNDEGTIDGVGFQMHVYMDYPSLSHFENAFQQVVDLGLKVKVTELDVSVVNPYGAEAPPQPEYDEELAGAQKLRFCQITQVYLDTVPAELRGGFTIWGLTDDETWLMHQFEQATGAQYDNVWPVLFNSDKTAKPALQGVADAFTGQPCTSEF